MIKLVAETVFSLLLLFLGAYSLLAIYVLLRYGQSRVLGLTITALYAILMLSLYAGAMANFNRIPFPP